MPETQLKAIGAAAGTNIVSFFAPTNEIAAQFVNGQYYNINTEADAPNNALLNPGGTTNPPIGPTVINPTK